MKYEKLTEILMESLKDTYYKSPITNYAFFLQGEHKLLNHLYICGEVYKKPAELCRELYMTSARVSAALKILEKKGYIKRRASQKDKRNVMVFLTDNGKDFLRLPCARYLSHQELPLLHFYFQTEFQLYLLPSPVQMPSPAYH